MNDFRLSVLKPRYEQLFNSCLLRSSWLPRISSIAEQILSQREPYDAVEAQTAVPWWFVGILHYRDLNFRSAHLHNGDPLTNRTINAPQGYPVAPPANGISYTFVESASDVLRLKKFDKAKDRSIAAWLWRFEGWNGFGYANMGLNSEYLWNGTNQFGSGNNRGMFLANGQFDSTAKSDQAGTAALVWYMHYQGIIAEDDQQPQPMVSQSAGNWNISIDTTASGNGSVSGTVQTPSPFAVQTPTTMQMADAFRYYQQLPHQEQALAWLQQQLAPDLLAEFTRRWEDSATVTTPVTAAAVGGQDLRTQNWGMASNTLSVATPAINHAPPPPPVVQPQRTLAESIIAYCQEKGYTLDRGVGEKNIIYVEGMYPDGRLNDDALNAWNDARLVIEFQNGSPVIIKAWEATTEPGRYYTMQPLNLSGVARIAFGQYKSWQVGTHGQSDPHEALIQTGGAVTVYRDLNKDGMRSGDRTDTGYFGINQHWGGDSPASDIGAWSAGCLVGRTRDGHREFMALCKQDPRYMQNRGYVFQAAVIPGDDLFKRYPPTMVNQSTPAATATAVTNPPSPPQNQPLVTAVSGTSGAANPPLQSLNQAILQAALALKGMSTADGPDGGNNACAWSLNRVLAKAGIPPLGENPNYVPSLVDALKGGRGQQVDSSSAKAGDLVIADGEAHIGVGLDEGCATVLSNSSSRACFKWESGRDFDGSYGGSSTIYRLLK